MAAPMFDFSRLSPDKRIQLAKDLWDSLSDRRPARGVDAPDRAPAGPLSMRRTALRAAEPTRGRPWRDALDEIEQRAQ